MIEQQRTRKAGARKLVAACAALLCAGFLALGIWQLQRLQWKTTLIAQVDQRVHAAPAAAPSQADWQRLSRDRFEYLHIRLHGQFLDVPATLVQAATVRGSGYWVLAPFAGDDGGIVLVNRGFVPAAAKPAPPASSLPSVVTGLLRMSEPGGGFLRQNDPLHERWYSRDVAAIAAARGLPQLRVAPYFVDQDGSPEDSATYAAEAENIARPPPGGAAVAPIGGLTVVSFNNNHLVYALTWFAMALMAAGACVFIMRERGQQRDSNQAGQSD
jgi:surfeit locus 1 family protein